MGYRDDDAVLRERIERLELQLARSAGQSMLLREQRDAAWAELAHLKGDRRALARARSATFRRSALHTALRVAGVVALGLSILPVTVLSLGLLFGGDIGAGLLCAVVPFLGVLAAVLLGLPGFVQWLERRGEMRRELARLAELSAAPRVRVAPHHELDRGASYDDPAVARSAAAARRRGGPTE